MQVECKSTSSSKHLVFLSAKEYEPNVKHNCVYTCTLWHTQLTLPRNCYDRVKRPHYGVVVLWYGEKAQETKNQKNLSVSNTPSLKSWVTWDILLELYLFLLKREQQYLALKIGVINSVLEGLPCRRNSESVSFHFLCGSKEIRLLSFTVTTLFVLNLNAF